MNADGTLRRFAGHAAAGPDESLYIADTGNHRIVRLLPDGTAVVVAGTGEAGGAGDGGPATAAKLYRPTGVASAADGAVYIADTGNHRVRRVDPEGTISTIAGTGTGGDIDFAQGSPTESQLLRPEGIGIGPDGSVFVADTGNDRVRVLSQAAADSQRLGFGLQ